LSDAIAAKLLNEQTGIATVRHLLDLVSFSRHTVPTCSMLATTASCARSRSMDFHRSARISPRRKPHNEPSRTGIRMRSPRAASIALTVSAASMVTTGFFSTLGRSFFSNRSQGLRSQKIPPNRLPQSLAQNAVYVMHSPGGKTPGLILPAAGERLWRKPLKPELAATL
jgi:hypothetical protein